MNKPLLYDLYNEIRMDKQWIAPGMEEYYLLVDLLHSKNFKINSFDDFAFVLETIWLKSHHQKEKFRNMLEVRRVWICEIVEVLQKDMSTPVKSTSTDNKPETIDSPVNETEINDAGGDAENKEGKNKTNEDAIDKNNNEINSTEPVSTDGSTSFSLGNMESGKTGTLNFQANTDNDKSLAEIPYLFTNEYLPVKSRQLQQAWRTLKNNQDGPNTSEINISKTIEHTAKQGYFNAFLNDKKFINQLHLFIFLDQSESMIAVEEFGNELTATAKLSDLHPQLVPWYFYQLPQKDEKLNDYTVRNEDWTRTSNLRKLFAKLNKKDIVVLIYSDAGTLKDQLDIERCEKTIKFIRHLYLNTGYLAWLNPAPKNRWKETNAELISEYVPMFETNKADVENAIAALKGKLSILNK